MKKEFKKPIAEMIAVATCNVVAASSSKGDYDPDGKLGDNARRNKITNGISGTPGATDLDLDVVDF